MHIKHLHHWFKSRIFLENPGGGNSKWSASLGMCTRSWSKATTALRILSSTFFGEGFGDIRPNWDLLFAGVASSTLCLLFLLAGVKLFLFVSALLFAFAFAFPLGCAFAVDFALARALPFALAFAFGFAAASCLARFCSCFSKAFSFFSYQGNKLVKSMFTTKGCVHHDYWILNDHKTVTVAHETFAT